MNALLDKDFLKELDNYNNREIYARITALTANELPIEMIEGRVTGGSINIDGASAVRRTCSLTIVAEGLAINNFYWGLNNKFKLEVGLKNFIDSKYPEIIWFPQGIYIINSFNTRNSTNNFTISISGKDKMCMLNGEVGGSLPASIDFGVEEIINGDQITYNKVPIKNIIREMLHAYALEPYHNIVINDLEEKGLELLEYRGETPLYLAYDIGRGEYTQMYFSGETKCKRVSDKKEIRLDEIPEDKYNKRVDEIIVDKALKVTFGEAPTQYTISKVEFGQTAGYRLTDLIYPGDLISNIGESITSILDKIVKMLGNFEYFYDLDGRFIFQKKKTYINTSWSPIIKTDEDMYVENAAYADQNVYYFNGNNLVSALSNNPNWNNVKNDYSIWGTRKGISGAELPVHFRYAIHKKPEYYKAFDGKIYTNETYDWREIIYQMALDYFKHNQEDNFYVNLIINNGNRYPSGMTGYEQFYTDLEGFWRDLYDPEPKRNFYEYYYGTDEEKDFTPINENKQVINELFVYEDYEKLSSESKDIDKMQVMALRQYNEKYELHPLIDTIPINYVFGDDGKQKHEEGVQIYYITANNEAGYKEITENIYKNIEKKEIYIKNNEGKMVHILDTINLDDNCYLKLELNKNGNPKSVFDLPEEIQKLYYLNNKFNKYYLTSQLGLDGKVIPESEKKYNYFTYYVGQYDFFREEEIFGDLDLLYWNKNIKENPDQLDYWLDFLDCNIGSEEEGELGQYAISAIGNRPKVVNDSNVKSIYYRNVPNLIFTTNIYNDFKEKSGYIFMQITEDMHFNYFNISAQGKSAKNMLDELIYQHSYITESISITAIPIYYLQPNTRISVLDNQSKINGEYIISKISLPLTYNGQMTIQATKAPQRFN